MFAHCGIIEEDLHTTQKDLEKEESLNTDLVCENRKLRDQLALKDKAIEAMKETIESMRAGQCP